ncbi:alpha/beta fold hydrolase [Conexibacter stalactiti]|uniref:Alpha/beta fold hydrolase n=1 Tax=Conexibacter stalactiti TaxID=1940611 RepID=A0ABU4HYQ8_9ACTN|nr:alpha/beta fold hydrolase [Conexibacter stalactiti]MDW5597184.1 alpha/beta fold hydrolase [Conexibacter stalactiti]MEC5037826.1 alpha/beta fold hydrolase [Conexibacter stalactiti]
MSVIGETSAALPIAWDRLGDGEPLLLLHGLGGERHVWEPVLAPLAAHRTLIVPDLPGFGASPALPGHTPPTPAALAAAIAGLLDALGLDAPDVAGNSLGGWVALELALAGRARSVTALCPAGFWSRPLGPRRDGARRFARAVRPLLPLLTRVGPLRRAALAGTVARPQQVPARAAARLIGSYAAAPGFLAADAAMRAGRFARIADVTVPVTLAWGERDRLVRPPRELPLGVVSVLLPGCGHLPMWDDPALVTQVVLRGAAQAA